MYINNSTNAKLNKIRGFGGLPAHVLVNIFQYFDEEELRNNIIPVCQQWRLAAENPILWRTLTFVGNNVKTTLICDKIWQYNQAEDIYLKHVLKPIIIIRQICRCSKYLQYLTLRYCSGITEDALRHVISKCKHLRSLDLKGTPFSSLIFYEELACMKNLTSINLSENKRLTRSNILTVAVNCRRLEGFHLSTFEPTSKFFLDDSDCYFILTSIMHELRHLSLDCSSLNSYAISFVRCCYNLRYLCLNYAYNFDGSHFQLLWKSLTKLTTLKVRFAHQITDLNVKHLFEEGSEALANLEVIDFTGCLKISDGGINAIANCCGKLRTLNIRGCKNIRSLLLISKNCKLLEILNVAFCENLDTNQMLVPAALKVLYISDRKELRNFANLVRGIYSGICIKMCDSEFNKFVVNYK
ncbi:hypothetical protein NQ317_015199 [Molorchus minor]|uniref:F-box domain-containing protein n=1 Tax=Molorchus minor TaxID=1323400 RepID=A0ABQ9JP33_9CUCU|nr:hypothetical protein NQ317_015199 [Molorchus minor]